MSELTRTRSGGSIHERHHNIGTWLLVMQAELGEATAGLLKGEHPEIEALEEILQVVAVGVACLEQHGIVERDWDHFKGKG